jgi:glycosyltransferase involved in cell wall biosynthesis
MSYSVLYLHHYGNFGGASRSLLELLHGLPQRSVIPHVITAQGQFAAILHNEGIQVIACRSLALFDNTRYSYYRGLRWFVLLRELMSIPSTVAALFRARRAWPGIQLIHANEITLLPTAILARFIFRVPLIVHVRAVQSERRNLRSRMVARFLRDFASRVIAIDRTVRESLPADVHVEIVHNSLNVSRERHSLNTHSSRPFTVGMIGTLQRAKGCLDFVRAAAICKTRGIDAKFLVIGQSARQQAGLLHKIAKLLKLSQEIESELREIIEQNNLQEYVELQGFRENLEPVYASMDVVCFPSFYDAPGRPIFEAALFGVPSIAAISNPKPDTFIPGITGLAIPSSNPTALADAILSLVNDTDMCKRLGRQAQTMALENFDPVKNAQRVLIIYEEETRAFSE